MGTQLEGKKVLSGKKLHTPEQFAAMSVDEFLFYCGATYVRTEAGQVIVQSRFSCDGLGLPRLPDLRDVLFKGSFSCVGNALESLEGAPMIVGGHFICFNNPLKSLKGLPMDMAQAKFDESQEPLLRQELARFGLPSPDCSSLIIDQDGAHRYVGISHTIAKKLARCLADEVEKQVLEEKQRQAVRDLLRPRHKFRLKR